MPPLQQSYTDILTKRLIKTNFSVNKTHPVISRLAKELNLEAKTIENQADGVNELRKFMGKNYKSSKSRRNKNTSKKHRTSWNRQALLDTWITDAAWEHYKRDSTADVQAINKIKQLGFPAGHAYFIKDNSNLLIDSTLFDWICSEEKVEINKLSDLNEIPIEQTLVAVRPNGEQKIYSVNLNGKLFDQESKVLLPHISGKNWESALEFISAREDQWIYLAYPKDNHRLFLFAINDAWKSTDYNFDFDDISQPKITLCDLDTEHFSNPTNVSFKKLLSCDRQLLIPFYQRVYSWKEENIRAFFDSVDSAKKACESNKSKPYYMGSVLTSTSTDGDDAPKLVIDGQQRLTTLYLTITACVELIQSQGNTEDAKYLARLHLIRNAPNDPESHNSPTLIPAMEDRATFYKLCNQKLDRYLHGDDANKFQTDKHPKLLDSLKSSSIRSNYDLIYSLIQDKFLADEERDFKHEDLSAWIASLRQSMTITSFSIPHEKDPYTIFQRMNDSGRALTIVDLVRSELLRNCDPNKGHLIRKEKLDPFERAFSLSPIKPSYDEGKAELYRSEHKEKNLKEFYEALGGILSNGKKKSGDAYQVIKREIETQVKAHGKDEYLGKLIDSWTKYARWYQFLRCLREPESTYPTVLQHSELGISKGLWDQVRLFSLQSIPKPMIPMLIGLLDATSGDNSVVSEKTVSRVIKLLDTCLVRGRIAGWGNSGLMGTYWPLASKEWKHKKKPYEYGDPEAIKARLLGNRNLSIASLDNESIESWFRDPVYKPKIESFKYILYVLEAAGRNNDPLPDYFMWNQGEIKSGTSVEHIYPQKPAKGTYPKFISEDDKEKVGRPGNLTLLTMKEQRDASNYDYKTKLKVYETSLFNISKSVSQDYTSDWSPEYINKRGDELLDLILNQWPEPESI